MAQCEIHNIQGTKMHGAVKHWHPCMTTHHAKTENETAADHASDSESMLSSRQIFITRPAPMTGSLRLFFPTQLQLCFLYTYTIPATYMATPATSKNLQKSSHNTA
jgi:hypothetical protein